MPLGDFPLKDKIVLITGGGSGRPLHPLRQYHSSCFLPFPNYHLSLSIPSDYRPGIGLAFAALCISLSARVLIADLQLTRDASKLIADHKDAALYVQCDVADWAQLENLISESEKLFGTAPDVYVPNAGIYEPVIPLPRWYFVC